MAADQALTPLPELTYHHGDHDPGLRITSLQDLFEFHRSRPVEESALDEMGNPCINIELPHRLEFFTLIYVSSGVGTHWIDFERHDYGPGSLLITSMNQVQNFVPNDAVRGLLVQFTEPFLFRNLGRLDAFLLDLLYSYDRRTPMLQGALGEELSRAVDDLATEIGRAEAFAQNEMLQLLVKRVLLEAARLREPDQQAASRAAESTVFVDFKRRVEAGFWRTRSAQAYASDLGVSYKHLNEICKAAVGLTAKTCIDNAVVLEAKRRLAIDDTPVSQVASVLGFAEPSNFTKFFAKRVGSSPTDYRASLRSSN